MGVSEAMMVGQIAGSGVSAIGSINEGVQAKKWAKYQAKQAKYDAFAALGAARVEANKIRQAATELQGQAVAATAASGVTVGEGSTALIEQSIRQRSEQDALMTIFDGQDALRRGLSQAQAYKSQGEAAFNKGLQNSFGSLITAVGAAAVLGKELWNKEKGDGDGGNGKDTPSWLKVGALKNFNSKTGTMNGTTGGSSVSSTGGSGSTGGGK